MFSLIFSEIFKSVFLKDKYMIDNRPSYIAYIPFIYNRILIGVIYLEINMTTEKFNASHIEATNILINKVIHGGKLEHLIQKNKIENSHKSIPSNIKLSRREKVVLELLAQGMSNKEIGLIKK